MRRRVRGLLLAVGVASITLFGIGAGALARTRVTLRPGSGHPATKFVVSFRAPDQTGTIDLVRRRDTLSVRGPKRHRGCVSSVNMTLRAHRKGRLVKVTLNPKRLGGVWCAGRFRGRIVEFQQVVCQPHLACPQLMIAPRTIARFSFRVKRAPAKPGSGGSGGGGGTGSGSGGGTGGGGTQTQGPTFAGLITAMTCSVTTPRPELKSRVFTLHWDAATDPVTPSAGIVYEIFYSATPGGENYSTPLVSTPAGTTTYSVSVAAAGAAYFVVRARDQAGLEDQNTAERQGVSVCG
jgi:hypothetical protein